MENTDETIPIDVDDSDDEDPIEEEQLNEYREMVENLGTFPDKVKINSLSMVAEDHADSKKNAAAIYNVIKESLISKQVSSDRKLPLVYVVDSILKNVRGKYIAVIETDAGSWLSIVYQSLPDDKRAKLKKVYNLWRDAGVFSEASWKKMGAAFAIVAPSSSGGPEVDPKLVKAGINYGNDGSMLLMPKLRKAMQTILDDLQSDVQDELEKVSLERLASIDPDLLVKIKSTAEDALRNGGASNSGVPANAAPEQDEIPSFLVDTRSATAINYTKAWENLKIDPLKESHDIIAGLRHVVIEVSKSDATYTQKEAIGMTNSLGAAGAMAGVLTTTLERIRDVEKKAKSIASSDGATKIGSSGAVSRGFFAIDKSLFTSDGIKTKNMAVVGMLYEIGLPFTSTGDGRRFATQWELSNHLDALFKKNQLEKTIARTEERGWYVSDSVWSGEAKESEDLRMAEENIDKFASHAGTDAEVDPSTLTVPADESRDRCVICGINFKMFFDHDEGIYMYNNCREIEVLNDEAAAKEKEDMLVHVTCWRALGSPEFLTADQTLQDSLQ